MSQRPLVSVKMLLCQSAYVLCLCFVFFLIITKDCVGAKLTKSPSKDFSRHSIVTPTVHHARTKRELAHTRNEENGLHHPELTLTVEMDGEPHVLDLRLKKDLVAGNHVIRYQKNGETVMHRPTVEELDICQYSGKIRGKEGSWAAVSTCHGVRGVIYDGKTMKYIEPIEGNGIQTKHYVYDHADLTTDHPCGYGGVTNNTDFDPPLMEKYHRRQKTARSRISRYKRSSDGAQVRGPYNANKLTRYVELVLVADNREFRANDENLQTMHRQLKDVANIINSVYAPLNIFIALVGVVVWTERDEIQLQANGDNTLTNFLQYRKQLITDMPNDNAQLLTRQKFNDGVVGKGLKGPICTYNFSGGVSTNHSEVVGLVAATVAHEMGHNFGMEHDTEEDCTCPDEKCIMSPSSTSVMPTKWSTCSLKSLALAFERGMDYCLRNKPAKLFDSPTCGNGFVEAGEQCDCGTSLEPSLCSACCVPETCMLRTNATCAAGECCDFETCRPKSAGTVCRAAERACDLPEYCTGRSEFCPDDVYMMDTTPCPTSNEAYCVRGACRSHSDQCRLLWGSTGEMSHAHCYTSVNVRGGPNGNCGYDRPRLMFRPCAPQHALCGMLHCRHLNEQLQFGMESVSTLAHTFINDNGTIAPCRTAIIDLGLDQVDPGLVPDGAKCGVGKMCMSQQCVTVESVRLALAQRPTSVCPSNCSGHGVCNSEGHCHCDPGFAPPLCALPGPGGSYDSGPATDPSIQKNFMVVMYVIFLGILPATLLVLLLGYYYPRAPCWQRPKKTGQSPKKTSLQQRISRGASKFAANFHAPNHPPAPPATVSSPDDMSSSLLRSDSDRSPTGQINPSVNFFGNFKGFSLTPIEKNQEEQNQTKVENKSAKITPVHRSSSNSQNLGVLKPVLRAAPPLPVVPKVSPKSSPSIKRANSSVQKIKAFINTDKTDDALPASSFVARPVISSPILEASTCTAKELISPLQGSKTLKPTRTAPTLPTSPDLPKRPLSMHSPGVPTKPLPEEPKKVKEGISLNRLASFLKHDKPKERNPVERSHSLPKNPNHQVKVPRNVDKVALRNLQISSPILQKEIELSVNTVPVVSDSEDGDDHKAFVNRTQSMRGPPVTQKPVIHSFGSMRQAPGVSRPTSVVGRPTAPPPPLPSHDHPVYQHPKQLDIKSTDYVDCIEEKQAPLAHIDEESNDNIYAIIEESPEKHSKHLPGASLPIKTAPQEPPEGYNTPRPITSLNSGSTESMGLLGEIVNEIQNRNIDSIYSAATILRRKKEREKEERDSTYANDYKTPESVYSNSGAKSSASTTSSGYLHPSAVNVPTFDREVEKEKVEELAPPSPTLKVTKIPTFARQVTPPTLKNTSSFRQAPPSPKNTPKVITRPISANSPDLVSSCAQAEAKNVKPPDVINNNKPIDPPKVTNKPSTKLDNRPPLRPAPTIDKKPLKTTPSLKPVGSSTNLNNKPINRVNSKVDSNVKAIADSLNKNKPKIVPKPPIVQKMETKPAAANKLQAKPSNVASLQQKFENRKSIGREPTVKK